MIVWGAGEVQEVRVWRTFGFFPFAVYFSTLRRSTHDLTTPDTQSIPEAQQMPTYIPGPTKRAETCKVTFAGVNKTVECKPHTNLRDLALEHDIPMYNGLAKYTNCQGHGLCGTCTVEVTPQQHLTEKGALENLRFIQLKGNLRLACQTEVTGDVVVTKHRGHFGTRGYDVGIKLDEVKRLYQDEEWTVAQIAEHFQCPPAKIVNVLERSKVEFRRPGSVA